MKITLTRKQILEMSQAFGILSALPIEPKLRYAIAKNKGPIQEELGAFSETLGPISDDPGAKAKRDALSEKMLSESVEIDLYRIDFIPEFHDIETPGLSDRERHQQDQAIMQAILPIVVIA